jgi:hypothetical protein
MYQFDIIVGASPAWATVKEAPLVPYVGAPCAEKLLLGPLVKSKVSEVPSAGSGGHVAVEKLAGGTGKREISCATYFLKDCISCRFESRPLQ